jgi:hypothetical protein
MDGCLDMCGQWRMPDALVRRRISDAHPNTMELSRLPPDAVPEDVESRKPCWRPVARGDHRLVGDAEPFVRDHGPWPVGRSERVRARLSSCEPDRCAGGRKASPRTSTRAPNTWTCPSRCRRWKGYPRVVLCDCGCNRTEDRGVSARCGSQGSRSGPRKRLSASRIGPFQDISQASFAQRQTEKVREHRTPSLSAQGCKSERRVMCLQMGIGLTTIVMIQAVLSCHAIHPTSASTLTRVRFVRPMFQNARHIDEKL